MIVDALAAHERWKPLLHAAIATAQADLTVEQATADDLCAFGHWLHEDAPWRARKTWDYANVRKLHAGFHIEAGRVLGLALAGRSAEASSAMNHGSPFAETSERLAFALRDWFSRINGQAEGTRS
jgi:hypothetical protein